MSVPILRGRLDAPSPNAPLRRRLAVFAGWALAGSEAPARVDVVLNGNRRISAEVGLERPDVGVSLNDPSADPACGWAAAVDLTDDAVGELKVFIEVHAPTGESGVVAEQVFSVGTDELIGHVETPVDGAFVDGGLLIVNGWCSFGRGYARVEIAIDGRSIGTARTFITPPEESIEDRLVLEPTAGFEGRFGVDDQLFDGERHEVTVTAWSPDGEPAELASRSVTFRPWRVNDDAAELAELLRSRTAEMLAIDAATRTSPVRRGHLLVFAHDLALGGAELYLQDLLGQLLPRLESCTVVSPREGVLAGELRSMGVDVVIRGVTSPKSVAEYEGEVRQLASLVRTSGCGVVLVNSLVNSAAADAANRIGVPVIWALHESFDLAEWVWQRYDKPLRSYARERIETALRGASELVFVAEASRAKYLPVGIDPAASPVVSYGVDSRAIDDYLLSFDRRAARAEQEIDEDALVFVCVAMFAELKGQALLAEAFGRALDAHPDAVLVLVGDRKIPYAEAVHAVAERWGAERIKIVPSTSDTWHWYGLADVFVNASDIESMPRSILEAMTFGLPVLATSVVGVPEVVRDGENGWLMEPNDLPSMIAGLETAMAASPSDRRALGLAGRALVSERRFEVLGEEFSRLIDRHEPGEGTADDPVEVQGGERVSRLASA